jgi:hypothetical protein
MRIIVGSDRATRDWQEAQRDKRMAQRDARNAIKVVLHCPVCGRGFTTATAKGQPLTFTCGECDKHIEAALDASADKHLDGIPNADRLSRGAEPVRRP